jgi:hypothetical protein
MTVQPGITSSRKITMNLIVTGRNRLPSGSGAALLLDRDPVMDERIPAQPAREYRAFEQFPLEA